jgi:hypothetical protein
MNLSLRSRAILFGIFGMLLFSGCVSAPPETASDKSILASDKLIFKGGQCIGAIAQSKTPLQTGSTIRVIVAGQVVRPGEYELPAGSTVLEAIQLAGGFTDYAWTRDIHLIPREGTGPKRRLSLWKQNRSGKIPLVWLGTSDRAEDFELQDGMEIDVALQC